jgi:hypothetical protein
MELLPVLQKIMDLMIRLKQETKYKYAASLISIIPLDSAKSK